jgi:hypothetical protein
MAIESAHVLLTRRASVATKPQGTKPTKHPRVATAGESAATMRPSGRADFAHPWRRVQGLAEATTTRVLLAAMSVLAIFACLAVVSATTTTNTVATTSTSTTTAGVGLCGGVARCLDHQQCATCLSAINTTTGFPHTLAEHISFDIGDIQTFYDGFFETLMSNASCSTGMTPPSILHPALQELNDVILCQNAHGMVMGDCTVAVYACFVDPDCRQCLVAVLSAAVSSNGTKSTAFRSPACVAATRLELMNSLISTCRSFPRCSFLKQRCASLPKCTSCLATLSSGEGALAAQQCPGRHPSTELLDFAVYFCSASNSAVCSYWHQRCSDNALCNACLAGMGNGDSALAMVADLSTPACRNAAQDFAARHYLGAIKIGCPGVSACQKTVYTCVSIYGVECIACINMSALNSSPVPYCAALTQAFSIDAACQNCPSSVHTINAVVDATAAVGGISAAACITVVTTILAHGRDRAMRDRIVVGLMLANALYSVANALPLNALRTGVLDCGRLVMSFDAIRLGRAWWFCGKYGLVGFELLILGASIRALQSGSSAVSPRTEAMMHTACCALALLAFAVFYSRCASINADGYNTRMEGEAYTNAYNHVSTNDDLDDETPSNTASLMFQSKRDAYDNLVRYMLVAWDAVVGVAVGLWIVLRALHVRALRALRIEAAAAVRAEAADEWIDTRRSQWDVRRRLLEARREAFNEVAKPLEPYIAVFVLFAVPACFMSTTFCQGHSRASAAGSTGADGGSSATTDFTFGTCDVWCEFVLAFRSLGTVAVYLMSRERRAELLGVRVTWRKLCARMIGCVRCTQPGPAYAPLDPKLGDWYEMSAFGSSSSDGSGVAVTADASRQINEGDVEKMRVLGRGGFGEVWEGVLQPDDQRVAIKVMLAAAVDDDGDVVDPYADEDFRKECDALQRIDSPHLLKFFGFGTTASGGRFIVTELLTGGSLLDVLRNPERDLPWRTRAKIALQVALGMKHLHERHMLHRDLKSANVLLDEQMRAKVCDFGLSRVVRPTRQHVVHSPFTGVTRLLPSVDGVEINGGHESAMSFDDIAVSVLDARGTMTKAAGTLLWMAPEVYRGDRNYTGAVDVYSYGIVMWELATRKKPWVDELSHETVFFEQLNRALQTGRRPAIPDDVAAEHGEYVAVMQRCWAGDPADRPTFAEVATNLFFYLFKEKA